MREQSALYYLFALLVLCTKTLTTNAQQQFVQVASKENSYCNSTCTLIDIPELNKNTTAVVLATPVIENGINPNPHLIGIHFINGKWSIINLDQAAMPAGSKFNVQYYSTPDPSSQFVYTVTKETLKDNNTRSFINHPALNNNPEAKFQFIANGIGTGNNRIEVTIQYDDAAGQWYISTPKKNTLDYNTSYNIVIAPGVKEIKKAAAIAIPVLTIQPQAVAAFDNVQVVVMTVETQQGQFKSTTQSKIPGNKIELTGFNLEIATPYDLATGQSSGKRVRQPIIINKIFSPSSLQLQEATIKNQLLKTVTFEFYNVDRSTAVLVNTIKLTNARIVSFKQNIVTDSHDIAVRNGLNEEIKFNYQKIEMTDASGYNIIDDPLQNP